MPLQIRRGTEAERQSMIQALAPGEIIYVTDTQRIYVGNGSTLGGVAVTGYTDGDAQDAAAQMFDGVTHSGISFTYNDTTNKLTAEVDWAAFTGSLSADSVTGSVFADDSTILVDGIDQKVFAPGGFFGNLQGNVIGNLEGAVTGDVTGVITGLAGSTLVGNVTGDLTGDVTGNLTGNVIGNVTGDVVGSLFGEDSATFCDATSRSIYATTVSGNFVDLVDGDGIFAGLKIETNASGENDVDLFTIKTYHNSSVAIGSFFTRGRGTIGSPATIQTGDTIYNLGFAAVTTDGSSSPAALISASVEGTINDGIAPGTFTISTQDASGNLVTGLSIDSSQVITVAANTLVAGGGSGQVDTGSVATYLKINIGGTEYAIPAYAINP